MNARTLATSTLVAIAAVATAACERTQTPQTSLRGDDAVVIALSAPPAPSLVGTPIAETPATHAIDAEPRLPENQVAITAPDKQAPEAPTGTARDTPANEPARTLTAQKEVAELPLAGQVNNHSSDAFQSGRDESAAPRNGSAQPTPQS